MKIKVRYPSDEEEMYEASMDISIETEDGKQSCGFGAGEPEDMNLARDLNCAYNIEEMLVLAYNAGKKGEELNIEYAE